MADPRQRRQRRRLGQHQVGQGPSGQVGGGNAYPGVSARPAEAGRGVVRDGGAPVARHAEHTAPGVRDRSRAGRREHPPQHVGQRGHGRGIRLPQLVHPRAEPVGHAAPAERDPAVGGALRVHVRVGLVAQRFRPVPADLLPGLRRERLGHDHVAVHRQQRSAQPGQAGGVALGAAQHGTRPHVAELRPGDRAGAAAAGRPARLDGGDRRRLVDVDPAPLGRRRDPGRQRGRLDAGAGRSVEPGQRARHVHPSAQRSGGQELVHVIAVAPLPDRGDCTRAAGQAATPSWRPRAARPSRSRSRSTRPRIPARPRPPST